MANHINNWRAINNDPNIRAVHNFLKKTLLNANAGRVEDSEKLLQDFVCGLTVLDIGMVGHTIERSNDPNWKHNIIRKAASRVVGIDILEQPVLNLRNHGYDVRIVDATSDSDMGERFDRVVIGDVIEHVDNPVALLRFASRHLKPGGRIMCTTPNPFYVGNIINIIRDGTFIANAEHVAWVTPTMALELAHRSGIILHSYWLTSGRGNTVFRRILIDFLKLINIINSEFFARSYIYMFESDFVDK